MRPRLTIPFVVLALCAGCYHATIETGLAPSNQVVEKSFASGWIIGLIPPSTVETQAKCASGVSKVETQLRNPGRALRLRLNRARRYQSDDPAGRKRLLNHLIGWCEPGLDRGVVAARAEREHDERDRQSGAHTCLLTGGRELLVSGGYRHDKDRAIPPVLLSWMPLSYAAI